MRKLLVEDMRRPRHIDASVRYQYPLTPTVPAVEDTSTVSPAYMSLPIPVQGPAAFLLSLKSPLEVPAGSIKMVLQRRNIGYISRRETPQFRATPQDIDVVELPVMRVSTDRTGAVFFLSVSSIFEQIRLRLFWPVESFTLFLLTAEEALRYRFSPVHVLDPFQEAGAVDEVLADDFEIPDELLTEDFEV